METLATLDEVGRFRCPCGASHLRGPVSPIGQCYRCLNCGKVWVPKRITEDEGPRDIREEIEP